VQPGHALRDKTSPPLAYGCWCSPQPGCYFRALPAFRKGQHVVVEELVVVTRIVGECRAAALDDVDRGVADRIRVRSSDRLCTAVAGSSGGGKFCKPLWPSGCDRQA